jgi:AraC-like DNA-binding protein
MKMQENCAGVIQWEAENALEAGYSHMIVWCTEGQYAVCNQDLCISVLPGQCLMIRKSRFVAEPVGLTGHERGMVLLLDETRMTLPQVCCRFLYDLSEYALFTDHSLDTVFESVIQDSLGEELFRLKITELLLRCEHLNPIEPHTYRREELRLAMNACHYAMEQMQAHITIQEMAERAGKSPSLLKQCFHRVYGASVYQFIRKEKMSHAARMLAESNMKVIEIAQKTGYLNSSKFSKVFTEAYGMNPTAYRKAYQKGTAE